MKIKSRLILAVISLLQLQAFAIDRQAEKPEIPRSLVIRQPESAESVDFIGSFTGRQSFPLQTISLPSTTTNSAVVIGGSTLLNAGQANTIAGYLNEGSVTLTKIFGKTSGDGKIAPNFHAAADNQGRTITVLRVMYNNQQYLIGGYNPRSWHASGYSLTPTDNGRNAFLFNLNANFVQRQNRVNNPYGAAVGYYQTYNVTTYGPTFGGGHDLYVDYSLQGGYVRMRDYGDVTAGLTNNILNLGINYAPLQILGLEVFKVDLCQSASCLPNTPPTAVGNAFSIAEDTPLSVPSPGVLGNDADGENHPLTAVLVSAPSNAASFALNADGSFSYTPEPNYHGTDVFSYKANDGQADSNVVTVSINVTPVNDAPSLGGVPSSAIIDELAEYRLTASADDLDVPAQALVFSLVGAPAGATINSSTGEFKWTPAEAQGDGSTVSFYVRVSDGVDVTDAPISVRVNEVNSAPSLNAIGDRSIDEETVLTGLAAVATDADEPVDALTYTLVAAPDGMTINPATGVISWTPDESQGSGVYGVTVRVTDDGSPVLTAEQSFTITVNEVNRLPVLGAIAAQSGFWGNAVSFTAAATDPDAPANALTFALLGAPSGSSIGASSGRFEWTPSPGQVGSHTFTVRVSDNAASGGLSDEQSVTVVIGKRPTALDVNGTGSAQYSDKYSLRAVLTDNGGGLRQGQPVTGKLVSFTFGGQTASGSTGGDGIAETETMLTSAPNSTLTVATGFAGDASYVASNDSTPLVIEREDARSYFTGTFFVNSSCANCADAAVTLAATVKDIAAPQFAPGGSAPDAAYDAFPGDIRNATVTFVDRETETPISGCANLPVRLIDASDPTSGTASCNWAVNIGAADSADYTIGIVVDGHYTRNSAAEDTVVTVSKPLGANFISGGGYLENQSSGGRYAGANGLKTNFGFNLKYNKNGSNLQGRINFVVRGQNDRIFQIKGTVLRTLSVRQISNNSAVKAAVVTGKANLTDITDPLNPVSLGGNHTIQMELTDRGEPGRDDTLSLTLWSGTGELLFASRWDGARGVEQLLGGGNLSIR